MPNEEDKQNIPEAVCFSCGHPVELDFEIEDHTNLICEDCIKEWSETPIMFDMQ